MARLKKTLLVLLGGCVLASLIGARREMLAVEREAALWAEATEPVSAD